MQYTQEMILRSDSGYCMPYEEKGRDVQMSLGYGKQKHPHTYNWQNEKYKFSKRKV